MKIWANTLVKNEERYIWYSLMSAIPYVDKILVWDTGSTDNTISIIKSVMKAYPDKINFREIGNVDINEFTNVRQEMLQDTKADWMLILDGDEVWYKDSLQKHIAEINNRGELESIVTPYFNIVGDMYHYQPESAGKYSIDGKTGHLTIRFNSLKIPGLSFAKPHGQQGLFDGDGILIQDRPQSKRLFVDSPYFHFTHMPRTSFRTEDAKVPKRTMKLKYEEGVAFPLDFYYPEVFFIPHPSMVPSLWEKRSKKYELIASVQKPLKQIKKIFENPNTSGY